MQIITYYSSSIFQVSYRLQRSKFHQIVPILGIRTYSLVNSRLLVVLETMQSIQNEPLMVMECGGFSILIQAEMDGDFPIRILRQ